MRIESNSEGRERTKRSGCVAMLTLLQCFALAGEVLAQSYPTKPIRFIVGFGAGGGNDMIARTLGRKLTESMGQQVIVENRAGGAGMVAAVIAAKAPPDGYTLFAGSISTGCLTIRCAISHRSQSPR